MRKQCLITTVTMTLAIKGKRILEKQGIDGKISRLPPQLTASGCAFGISIDCALARRAKEVLENAGFHYGKLVYADGTPVLQPPSDPPSPISVTGTPRTTVPSKGGNRT